MNSCTVHLFHASLTESGARNEQQSREGQNNPVVMHMSSPEISCHFPDSLCWLFPKLKEVPEK